MKFREGDKVEFIYRNKKSVGVINGVYPEKQAVEVIVNGCLNVSFPDKAIAKVEEQERLVVPQFIADWYEQHRDKLEHSIWQYIYCWDVQKRKSDFYNFMKNDNLKPVETLIKMKDGYEVEKEPLYYVRLPFASRSADFEKETTYTYIIVNITTDEMQPSTSNRNYGSWKAELTEAQIKTMPGGDIYWQFAILVEEVEGEDNE
ncbi:DUF1642 domain-containing protein [Listeria monocytogenes]|uniref:DUF1642 domain-containing protein n=1 Tax=Listeria monocytogenes TaxID=1639 RepID=UPI000F13957C|nr:DUF1642 domain-containing protein [Listeria monocytogenes]EAC5807532.1 DUF1642 domain-containing protein [Listeria monocytogenes]EDN9144932.1 DUF1642 domain-containing protein [Listeria monocytogenes]MCV23079.1 DUF1642 domain-containing protein [Listeria monocytogenes]